VVSVHPSLPARSLKDLVALAKSRPGQLNYASTGSGSAGHLGVERLKKTVKMDVLHVPYKGGVQGMTDLVAGHVVMMFTSVMSTQSFARAGKVRMLAVAASQRSPSAPQVPTIAESGVPDFEVTSWWGLLVPAAVPKDIVSRLNSETVRIIGSQDARDRLGAMGADLKTTTPGQFAAFIRTEHATWGRLIRDTGARVD
jgi:tripartite-type tricarboxylate transporter receptor subunit TctC